MENPEEKAKINLDVYGIDIIDQIYKAVNSLYKTDHKTKLTKIDFQYALLGSELDADNPRTYITRMEEST